jgi:hypothetical protein
MLFFIRDWNELEGVPDLDRLIPDLAPLVARLQSAQANQYRIFRFDPSGQIKACFAFVRMDADMSSVPAEDLALTQAVQMIVLWSDRAFGAASPLARVEGRTILRPDIAGVIRGGYDPVMPSVARDASHAIRLAARLGKLV